MNITEKISYIKGLCEGLSLDEKKPEVKVINAIIDLLDDIAYDLTDMEELYDELSDQVDEIDQDLAEVESELYDEDCDCCDDDKRSMMIALSAGVGISFIAGAADRRSMFPRTFSSRARSSARTAASCLSLISQVFLTRKRKSATATATAVTAAKAKNNFH